MQSSFLAVDARSHFPLQNLPYGVFSTVADPRPRIGVAIADQILDLRLISNAGLFSGPMLQHTSRALEQTTLNEFMALGRPAWSEARSILQQLLSINESRLRDDTALRAQALVPQSDARMHLPATIGDYTDFFCSREHATNCGVIFRGPENALQPNWLHLPVAYHGRASSIVPSGTDVHRPQGQCLPSGDTSPVFRPSTVVDFELEMGCFIGPGNELGSPIPIDKAPEHIFGYVLVNDWSARDLQRWESTPLGPFTAKNWATSISPWIVTPDALEAFAVPPPPHDPPSLPYLQSKPGHFDHNYDVRLEASIRPANALEATTVSRSNMRTLYWTLPQMIAHHTVGGCNLRPGDLIATGTLSTHGQGGQGCLLELTLGGTRNVGVKGQDNEQVERRFLEDGDQVTLTGYCQGEGYRIGFGECTGRLLPAVSP